MNWLARLKKIENTPCREPTEPTKDPFVGFVAPVEGAFPENEAPAWLIVACDQPTIIPANRPRSPIDRTAAQIDLFARRGLRIEEAEDLVAAIAKRSGDFDERRTCLECRHLSGKQCARSVYAGAGRVVEAIVRLPQRCPAFEGAL